LRRVERAAAQDDLASRTHFARLAGIGARFGMRAVEALSLAIGDAARDPGVVEDDTHRERIELDVQPVAVRVRGVEDALAAAGPAVAAGRQRRVAEPLEAAEAPRPRVRIGAAAQPPDRARER